MHAVSKPRQLQSGVIGIEGPVSNCDTVDGNLDLGVVQRVLTLPHFVHVLVEQPTEKEPTRDGSSATFSVND